MYVHYYYTTTCKGLTTPEVEREHPVGGASRHAESLSVWESKTNWKRLVMLYRYDRYKIACKNENEKLQLLKQL